jgi:hypothetical protein
MTLANRPFRAVRASRSAFVKARYRHSETQKSLADKLAPIPGFTTLSENIAK